MRDYRRLLSLLESKCQACDSVGGRKQSADGMRRICFSHLIIAIFKKIVVNENTRINKKKLFVLMRGSLRSTIYHTTTGYYCSFDGELAGRPGSGTELEEIATAKTQTKVTVNHQVNLCAPYTSHAGQINDGEFVSSIALSVAQAMIAKEF